MIDPLTFIALLPAVVLVVYICRKDRTDKEPPALLAKLLGFGALSCLPAIVVELILSAIIERTCAMSTSVISSRRSSLRA